MIPRSWHKCKVDTILFWKFFWQWQWHWSRSCHFLFHFFILKYIWQWQWQWFHFLFHFFILKYFCQWQWHWSRSFHFHFLNFNFSLTLSLSILLFYSRIFLAVTVTLVPLLSQRLLCQEQTGTVQPNNQIDLSFYFQLTQKYTTRPPQNCLLSN